MKYGLVAEGLPTHVIRLAPIGKKLQEQGHEVVLIAPEKYRAMAVRYRLPFRPAGTDWAGQAAPELFRILRGPGGNAAFNRRGFQYVAEEAATMTPDVVRIASEERFDALIHDCSAFAASLAGEVLGIRSISVNNGLAPLIVELHDEIIRPKLNEVRAELGLAEEPARIPASFRELWTFLPKGLFLGAAEIPGAVEIQPEKPAPVGRRPDGDLELYAMVGASGRENEDYAQILHHSNEVVVRALTATGRNAAIGVGMDNVERYAAIAGPNVKVLGYTAQPLFLDAADVAVLHGGYGGVNDALGSDAPAQGWRTWEGTPAVYLPNSTDQFANAEALEQHGLGLAIPSQEATVDDVAERIEHIFANPEQYGAAMGEMRAEIGDLPTLDDVVAQELSGPATAPGRTGPGGAAILGAGHVDTPRGDVQRPEAPATPELEEGPVDGELLDTPAAEADATAVDLDDVVDAELVEDGPEGPADGEHDGPEGPADIEEEEELRPADIEDEQRPVEIEEEQPPPAEIDDPDDGIEFDGP